MASSARKLPVSPAPAESPPLLPILCEIRGKTRFSQYLGSEKRIQLGFSYPQLFLGKIRIRIRIENREDGLGFITTTPPPVFLFFFQKSCFGIKSEPSRNTSCDQGGQRRSSALLFRGSFDTDPPRRFLCCLLPLPLPIQCTHKPELE